MTAAPPAASAPPATEIIIPAGDVPVLCTHMGQIVEVHGVPVATGHARSGTMGFLSFNPRIHAGLSLVFFVDPAASAVLAVPDRVRSAEDLERIVGKELAIHGRLSDFKGDVQVVVRSLDQIRLLP